MNTNKFPTLIKAARDKAALMKYLKIIKFNNNTRMHFCIIEMEM